MSSFFYQFYFHSLIILIIIGAFENVTPETTLSIDSTSKKISTNDPVLTSSITSTTTTTIESTTLSTANASSISSITSHQTSQNSSNTVTPTTTTITTTLNSNDSLPNSNTTTSNNSSSVLHSKHLKKPFMSYFRKNLIIMLIVCVTITSLGLVVFVYLYRNEIMVSMQVDYSCCCCLASSKVGLDDHKRNTEMQEMLTVVNNVTNDEDIVSAEVIIKDKENVVTESGMGSKNRDNMNDMKIDN